MWCHISGEAAGEEIWNWSLLGEKGLNGGLKWFQAILNQYEKKVQLYALNRFEFGYTTWQNLEESNAISLRWYRLIPWQCNITLNEGLMNGNPENRELKQNRTARAMWGTRKRLFVFLMSLQLCLFLSWLKFLPFLPKFYCFIVSNYGRATVVISQNDVRVLSTT